MKSKIANYFMSVAITLFSLIFIRSAIEAVLRFLSGSFNEYSVSLDSHPSNEDNIFSLLVLFIIIFIFGFFIDRKGSIILKVLALIGLPILAITVIGGFDLQDLFRSVDGRLTILFSFLPLSLIEGCFLYYTCSNFYKYISLIGFLLFCFIIEFTYMMEDLFCYVNNRITVKMDLIYIIGCYAFLFVIPLIVLVISKKQDKHSVAEPV